MKTGTQDTINVVFASDSNYAQHATVAMTSILLKTAEPQRVVFYLLDDAIAEDIKAKMLQTVAKLGSQLHFVAVDSQNFDKFYVSAQLSRTAYFRLEMAELLPNTVDKVIYLDCDLLVLGDIAQLWDYPMEGKALGAVPDLGIMTSRRTWLSKQAILTLTPEDQYFNSGVLVVDLHQWRQQKLGQVVEQLAAAHNYPHHDQDALNQVFYGNWQPLPLWWNVIPPVWQLFSKILRHSKYRPLAVEAKAKMAVLHYAGGYKPWEYKLYQEFNSYYYQCLAYTEFAQVQMPQFDQRKRHRSITRQLWRIRVANWWQRFLQKKVQE